MTPKEMFEFWVTVNAIQLELDKTKLRLDTIRNKVACGSIPTAGQLYKLARIHEAMKKTAAIRR